MDNEKNCGGYEPFDRYMFVMKGEDKSFINKGPQVLVKENYRSKCTLMMVDEDDGSKAKVLRADQDFYTHDTNFSNLPDLP